MKLSVLRELSRIEGELQSERFPRLFQFQKSGLFQNRGNFNLEGFHFCPKIYPIFGVPEFRTILKPREFQVEGVSLLSVKLSVYRELSRIEGELQSEKIPAVIEFQKSGLF